MAENKGTKKINTKRKFVADGVFQAELNEFLQKTLGMEGYAGIEVRATSANTEIRVRAAKCTELLNKQTRKVKEIKSLIEKRYQFNDSDNKIDLAIKPLPYDNNLSAAANVETLKYKLLTGTPVRMAANNILGTVMRRGGAIGCEILIAGKVRGQRAKAQKYCQGYQVSTGQPKYDFIDIAVRSVELRAGVLGLKVKIMQGTKIKVGSIEKVMPDFITIVEPKDDDDQNATPQVIPNQKQEEAPAAGTPQ
jgi:small subunit ribosomal protein S3e